MAVILFGATITLFFSQAKLLFASRENAQLQRKVRLLETELEKVRTIEQHLKYSEKMRAEVLTLLGALLQPPEVMASIVEQLHADYDFVVLDSPPVLAIVDAVVLSRYSDGVVLVVDARRSRRRNVRRAVETLRAVEAPILGLVFNKSSVSATEYGYYGAYPTVLRDEAEIGQVDMRLVQPRVIVQCDPVDPLHGQDVVSGAVPIY